MVLLNGVELLGKIRCGECRCDHRHAASPAAPSYRRHAPRLAAALQVDLSRVSVKATTTETARSAARGGGQCWC
ncbi:MAG: hypothetical protein ACLUZZ_04160 [Alistipes inops]